MYNAVLVTRGRRIEALVNAISGCFGKCRRNSVAVRGAGLIDVLAKNVLAKIG